MTRKRVAMCMLVLFVVLALAATSVVIRTSQDPEATLPGSVVPISLDESTAYLFALPDGHLLFDTGYPWDFDTFRSAIVENGIQLSDIRYVFISHAHDDHAGFLSRLVRSHPDVRVIAHERTAALLATGENNTRNGGGLFNRWVYAAFRIKQWLKPAWTLTFPPYVVRPQDIILRNDEVNLSGLLGIPISVLYTPGHTSDSFSLIYGESHVFCGDLASTSFNIIGAKHLTVFNESIEDVYASWSKILDRRIPITVPSHGRPFPTRDLEPHANAFTQEDLISFF